jgi:hypothetical protein
MRTNSKTPGLRIVGGTDCKPTEAPATPATPTRSRVCAEARATYAQSGYVPFREWVCIEAPKGNDDRIFHEIERHLNACITYNNAVEAESAAEDKVSAKQWEAVQAASRVAYDDLMLFARALVIVRPTSRQGLIRVAQYLAGQFNERGGGCTYMPNEINGKPWPQVFLGTLALSLRKMGAEFPKEGRTPRSKKPSAVMTPQEARATYLRLAPEDQQKISAMLQDKIETGRCELVDIPDGGGAA